MVQNECIAAERETDRGKESWTETLILSQQQFDIRRLHRSSDPSENAGASCGETRFEGRPDLPCYCPRSTVA